ncbi:hypothetical protein SAMN04487996_12265 [Dyadobacter soli]|uniref:Uncharacterized protein n=1 Tax=Dyadobacter soli TaxID=659014 RepID=A0A1G7WJ03_9BACT|nr:hypothetical protein [Dyadobacter soli]SDG71942.1 hypothetical protein SAMN04487996_12265 [Dyadobacter soli]
MIRLNGFEVYVPAKQSINYQLVNPHLLYDQIPSSQAEIPTFPAVRTNRAIFDYWEEPQAGSFLPEMHYEHFEGGELIREGFFLLTEASLETGYKGAFTDRLGLFFGDYQNLSLQEIDFGNLPLETPVLPEMLDVDGITKICCFPTIINESFYGSNGPAASYAGRINDYLQTVPETEGEYVDSPVVPMFFVGWVLERIGQITGTKITGSFLTHPVWSKLILANLREVENGQITVKNHLPPFSITGLILELRKIANLKFDFNSVEKTLKIDFWEDCLAAPTQVDWSNKATFGENKTPENNTRIQLSMIVDGNDAIAKDKPALLQDYISQEVPGSRNGIAKLDMRFSTMLTDPETGLAICKQEGQSSQFAQDAKPWGPRLLFWHGVSDLFPRALPTLGTISLFPASLAATCWKETIALRKRSFYLKKEFIITETDIAKLDFGNKCHVDGVDYIIAQLNVGVPVKGTAQALLIGGI